MIDYYFVLLQLAQKAVPTREDFIAQLAVNEERREESEPGESSDPTDGRLRHSSGRTNTDPQRFLS